MVEAALRESASGLEVQTRIISTRGDLRTMEPIDPRAGRKGLFTGEIERALVAGEIDVAVHSAKDLPSELTSGLEIAAVLPRAAIDDVLIRKNRGTIAGIIGTGSVRRQYQLRSKFPSVQMVELRGNVPTRIRKFIQSDWQGIVLARAGLERLGYDVTTGSLEIDGMKLSAETLSTDDFLPAGGQGIIALEVRTGDVAVGAILRATGHAETFRCLEAEREFLHLLQGDCGSPVGVLATISGTMMTMRAQVFEPPRLEPASARVESDSTTPKKLARDLWEAINGRGN